MIHRFERPEPPEIDLDLTNYLQGIALRGWSNVLQYRTMAELGTQFKPMSLSSSRQEESIAALRGIQGIYKEYASYGGLLLAYTEGEADPVGFSLADTEISGNLIVRSLKKLVVPKKIYAHARHICIDRQYQGNGYFYPLVAETYDADIFVPWQIPTAHIFRENEVARNAFMQVGFRVDPPDQQPKILEQYFGPVRPVEQLRFAAESVESVIDNARSHSDPQTT